MSEQKRTSLWQRVRHLFAGDSGASSSSSEREETEGDLRRKDDSRLGGEAAGGEKGREAAWTELEQKEKEREAFSAVELRDRVVVMLLFDQVVHIDQVAAAWQHWKDESVDTPDTLWRVVALLPEVDREAVFAQAARVYAFEPVDFNMYGARALLRKHRSTFTRAQWKRMVDLNVAPVRTEYDEEKEVTRWVFATHDPARPAVQRLLSDLDVASHTLRYAPQTPLQEVFDDALPRLARERATLPPLPHAPEGREAERETRRFLENFARGSSFVEAALREAEGGAAAGQRKTAAEAKSMQSGAAPVRRKEAAEDSLGPAALFDDVLAGVVQAGARAAYLFGNDRGQLEVYHRKRRTFKHWRTEEDLSAEAMIDFVSGHILSLRPARQQSEEAVECWVAGRRLEVRPAIIPATELPKAFPAEGRTEVVVIEVLR